MIDLFLHEIVEAQLLGSSDIRYIKKWLKDHNIDIYSETERMPYVKLPAFEEAYNEKFTMDLIRKFPDDWKQRYQYYNTGDITSLIGLREQYYQPSTLNISGGTYTAQCQQSKNLLAEFLSEESQ